MRLHAGKLPEFSQGLPYWLTDHSIAFELYRMPSELLRVSQR